MDRIPDDPPTRKEPWRAVFEEQVAPGDPFDDAEIVRDVRHGRTGLEMKMLVWSGVFSELEHGSMYPLVRQFEYVHDQSMNDFQPRGSCDNLPHKDVLLVSDRARGFPLA